MNKICGTCTYGHETHGSVRDDEPTVTVECFLNPPALVQLNVGSSADGRKANPRATDVWQRPLVDLSDTCSHWLNTR